MSGLFHRLAGQALEQRRTTLHAQARLPFHGPAEPLIAAEPEPELPAANNWPNLISPQAQPQSSVAIPRENAVPPAAAVPPWAQAPAAVTFASADTPSYAPALPLVLNTPSATEDGRRTGVEGIERIPPASAAHARTPVPQRVPKQSNAKVSLPAAERPQPPAHDSVRDAEAPPPARVARSTGFVDSNMGTVMPHAAVQPALSMPDTLLPRQSLPGLGASPAQITRQAPREPDEVHIHIGRIEVTAIREPEQRKRETRKGSAPLSLDDYLSRRKGNGK